PRPETELLVEQALAMLPAAQDGASLSALDLGVGSGAILISLIKARGDLTGVGVDCSARALEVARFNAAALDAGERITLIEGDWGAGLEAHSFDLIVSNPPYVKADAIGLLQPEVARFEPRLALDGGADGLDAYRALLPDIARLLKPSGAWAVEIGQGQAEAVWAYAAAAGLKPQSVREDLAGIARVVCGQA
ncbi:MAG: class I SAM-dependent methyltransferase, partial [Hyphomonadaceae bacterium]